MKKTKILIGCIIFLFLGFGLINLSNKTFSQSTFVGNKVISSDPKSLTTGQMIEIDASFTALKYNGEDLKDFIMNQPLPQIQLSLKESNVENLSLSKDASNALNKHWLIILRHLYLTKFANESEEINYQKEDITLSQSTFDTRKRLTDLPISSEYQLRNFSSEEASQLVRVLRDSANKITKE